MNRIDDLAKDFLAQQRIAVAGVSDTRETTGNFIYRTLRSRGYTAYGINPHTASCTAISATPTSPPFRRNRTAW